MTSLIASLSSGKGTWTHVSHLIKSEEWEHIYLITNQFGKENYKPDNKTTLIIINDNAEIEEIIDYLKKELDGKIIDTEVAVNLVSGTGKEHMAIMSSVLKLGLAIRLVYCSDNKCVEI